jgi:hypothetical protein
MTIQRILDQIREQTKLATTEVEREPISTYNNRRSFQRQAGENLDNLFIELKNSVKQNHVLMIGMGNGANKFGEVVQEHVTTINVDGLYEQIADQLDPRLYTGKHLNAYLFDNFISAIDVVFKHLDIKDYVHMTYDVKYSGLINDRSDLIKVLKRVINDKFEADIMGVYIMDKAARTIISNNVAKTIVPIYVPIEDELLVEDALKLANRRTFFIGAGNLNKELKKRMNFNINKIDEENALEILSKIRSMI